MKFKDRADAAQKLSQVLTKFKGAECIVLAVPRGAVPMARQIADDLGAPLDLVLVRKVGAPADPEFAIGSVTEYGDVIPNPDFSDGLSQGVLLENAPAALRVLEERREKYCGSSPRAQLNGKTVIIVDDGIATGSTLKAAVESTRRQSPGRVVVAAPVASSSAVENLKHLCDDIVVLEVPEEFHSVGEFFEVFPQVTDDEVCDALKQEKRK